MDIILSDNFIEEVKAHNNIVDIISRYISLKKVGKNYKGLCPFHKEKTPSFMVSDEKQFFHCFGCNESGDVISFIMKTENLDFPNAVTLLGEWVGIYPEKEFLSDKEKFKINQKNIIYQINRHAAIFYYKNLHEKNQFAIQYLRKRGLNYETIKKFGLGYAENQWESLNLYLLDMGYSQEDICAAGLAIENKNKNGFYDRFRNRIIFPILNITGKVIGFGGRALDSETMPKYLNSPETLVFQKSNNLYGLNFAKKNTGPKRQIIVVEGYMDVLSLYKYGIKNAVASLGTALTVQHAELLKKHASEIFIAYDADEAGEAATLRSLEIFNKAGCNAKVIRFPKGQDPDQYILKNGEQAFKDKIQKALSWVDYKIILAKEQINLQTAEGKIQFVNDMTNVLRQLKSPIEKDAYIQKIAQESQISIEAIKKDVYGYAYNAYPNAKKPILSKDKYRSKSDWHNNKYKIKPIKPVERIGYIEAERSLLKILMTYPGTFERIRDSISYNDFTDATHKKIARIFYDFYIEGNLASPEEIYNQLNQDEYGIFEKIREQIIPEESIDRALLDYKNTIQKNKLIREKNQIQKQLKIFEEVEDRSEEWAERIKELCIHYEEILKELKKS